MSTVVDVSSIPARKFAQRKPDSVVVSAVKEAYELEKGKAVEKTFSSPKRAMLFAVSTRNYIETNGLKDTVSVIKRVNAVYIARL